jgi:serralysin
MHKITYLAAGMASLVLSASQAMAADPVGVCICGVAGPHNHATQSTGSSTAVAPFQLNSRWSGTVASGSAGGQGDPITLRWSIVPDGTAIPGGVGIAGESANPSSLRSFFDGLYGAGPGGSDLTQRPWFTVFNSSFNRWAALSGITYVYEPADDGSALYTAGPFAGAAGAVGVRGDSRIGAHLIDGSSGVLAYNFFPNTGEMVIDTGDTALFGPGANNNRSARNILTHEFGHGIGLNHTDPVNQTKLMEAFLSTNFDGPQFDDILSAQRHYGDALEKGAGNNTAANASPLGLVAHGATVSRGTNADDAVVLSTETDFISIDDESDVDLFGFSVAPLSEVTLTLTPKGPTYNQGPQNGSTPSFNASALNNLNLQLIAADGTTVLATANTNGLGIAEIIAGFDVLAGGNLFARITGVTTDTIQLYRLDVTAAAVPEPGVLTLAGLAFVGLALRRRRA